MHGQTLPLQVGYITRPKEVTVNPCQTKSSNPLSLKTKQSIMSLSRGGVFTFTKDASLTPSSEPSEGENRAA